MSQYPECAKLNALRSQRIAVINFLDFLQDRGYHICRYRENGRDFDQIQESFQTLAHMFLEIDEMKLEEERIQMIDDNMRKTNDS